MDKATNVKQIIKAIGCDKLELVRVVGHAYWYFCYYDVDIYETESVYVPRLNRMTVDQWVEIGKDFVAKVRQDYNLM